jgi:hypothetical protein
MKFDITFRLFGAHFSISNHAKRETPGLHYFSTGNVMVRHFLGGLIEVQQEDGPQDDPIFDDE